MGLYSIFKIFDSGIYYSDYDSLDRYYHLIKKALDRSRFSLKNKYVMELGPGNSYILAYNFLRDKAKRAVLVDKYPRFNRSEKQIQHTGREWDYFRNKYNIKGTSNISDNGIPLIGIDFIAGDLPQIKIDHGIDLIYSIAVLHHIKDLDGYVKKMSELLNPGGMMYHVVDLKDKFHFFGNPFLFYKYSDSTWERFLTEENVTYTNRLRFNDYIDIFNKHSFSIEWVKTIRYDYPKIKINKKFASRDDLDIGDAHFLLKKTLGKNKIKRK
jgi:SAM-dependent methyltransferase